VAACHVCTSPSFERVLSVDGGNLDIHRCGSCDFVYLSSWERSLAKSEALYDYYGELTEEDLARRHSPENRSRQVKLLKKLSRYAKGRTLLDVGCGDGQLLQTATEEGWDALGIDLSPAAIRLCQQRGLRASGTDFFGSSLDDQRFDVIVMSELLEHVPSPQRFLKRAKELLEDQGVLYLTTPNFGSLARRLLGEAWSVIHPEHIGYFERSTLRTMAVDETGLREIRIDANNIAPSTLVAWWRGRGTGTANATAEAHRETRRGLDQRLRRAFHRSHLLTISKDLLNLPVSHAGLGDTLVAWLQKPPART
jgi:2-polyprenyl-3-methyl-5-hydroxy-6-metoxy-1,4-benzoquinol methylase